MNKTNTISGLVLVTALAIAAFAVLATPTSADAYSYVGGAPSYDQYWQNQNYYNNSSYNYQYQNQYSNTNSAYWHYNRYPYTNSYYSDTTYYTQPYYYDQYQYTQPSYYDYEYYTYPQQQYQYANYYPTYQNQYWQNSSYPNCWNTTYCDYGTGGYSGNGGYYYGNNSNYYGNNSGCGYDAHGNQYCY